jgi:agmatinase
MTDSKSRLLADPSGVGVRNGQFMGLECPASEARIVMLPIPWDVTTSYRPGTVNGPESIINASYQLDLYSPYMDEIWNMPLHTLEMDQSWFTKSQKLRAKSEKYIEFLEEGGDVSTSPEMQQILKEANGGCRDLHQWSEGVAREQLKAGKWVLSFGGDHSVSVGPIRAAADHFDGVSILHFDAHADLREAYEGFEDSHASIMFNVLKHPKVSKLVQVGIRDVSAIETKMIKADPRIKTYFDWDVQTRKLSGESWKSICQEIVSHLGPKVYISFDIDGLDPKLCPNTGTPVPGGMELFETTMLIQEVVKSGRQVVGADLVEVAPGPEGDEWDGNVGARALFQLAVAMTQSLKLAK